MIYVMQGDEEIAGLGELGIMGMTLSRMDMLE